MAKLPPLARPQQPAPIVIPPIIQAVNDVMFTPGYLPKKFDEGVQAATGWVADKAPAVGGAIRDAAMTAGTAINQGAGKVIDAVSSFAQAKAPEGGTKVDVDPDDEGPRRGVIWPAAFLPEVRKQANLGNDPIDLRRMSTANLDALKEALHPAMRKTWEDERQRRDAVRQMTGRLLEMGKTDAANKMLADARASAWAEDPSGWARQVVLPQKDEIQVDGSDVTIR